MQSQARNLRSGTRRKAARSAPRVVPKKEVESPVRAETWTRSILLCILIGMPLAILPARSETYDTTPKLVLLCLSLALLLWLPGRWWTGIADLWATPLGRTFYVLLIFGAASLLVSSSLSKDGWLSMAGTVWRRLGAIEQAIIFSIAGVVAAYVYRNRSAKTLMLGIEAAGAVASIYAILQYAGWDPLIQRSLYTLGTPPAVRPPATLGQATVLATFLLPPLLIAASFRLHENSPRWKRAHEAVLVLAIAALILSGTRSALLGLAAGACVLIFAERVRIVNRTALARTGLAALSFAAILVVFLLLPAGKGFRGRLTQWAGDRAGGPRLLVWRDSMQLLRQHPIAGIGPEQFEQEFRKAESLELARAYPDAYHESPHNFFLEIAIGQGLIGLAVWLALLCIAFWCGWRNFKKGDSEASALSAALLAMIISLQFTPLTPVGELYLLAISGISIALTAQRATGSGPVVVSPLVTVWARTASVALVLIASAYAAQTALYGLTESCALKHDLAGAANWYGHALRFPMPGPNLEISRQLAVIAQRSSPPARAQAFAVAKQAAEAAEAGAAEGFNALYQSGVLAIMTGDLPRAETKLRAAIDSAPAWYRPRMALASVLWWRGRNQEAEREAALALNCAGRLEPFVKRTLDGARAQARVMARRDAS
jgi:O-antigen ligase